MTTSPKPFSQHWPQVSEAGLTNLFAVAQGEPPATAYVPDDARNGLDKGPAKAFYRFCTKFDCSPLHDRAFLKELLEILKGCDDARRTNRFEVGSIIALLENIAKPQRQRIADATAQMRALRLAIDFHTQLVAERPEAALKGALPTGWAMKMEPLLLLLQVGLQPQDAWENWWEKIPLPAEDGSGESRNELLLKIEAALLAVTGLAVSEPPF